MSVSARSTTLTWERSGLPDERWCLVPNESDHRRRSVHPYRTACGRVIDGRVFPDARAVVDAVWWACDCKGVDRRPHDHVDPWPSRSVAGRSPLCLDCVAVIRQAHVEPGVQ